MPDRLGRTAQSHRLLEGDVSKHAFEFRQAEDGTWSWSGPSPGGTVIEQHGFRGLIDCVLAASRHGFTGGLDTYVVHRPPICARPAGNMLH